VRILTLSYEFPPLGGGGSKVAQGLSAELVKMGHQVDIITMSYRDLPREEVVEGVRVRRVPCIRSKVDVSHPHELASYMVRAAPAALRQGSEQAYDILHCHFILPDGVAALLPSSRLGIPLVVTAHGSDVPGYNPDRFKFLHRLIAPAWRSVVKRIDRIVCPSHYLEQLLLSHEPTAATTVIPNGFDLDRFTASRERSRRILVVTRMLERKGVQDVLRALAGTDLGFEIDIVGTGPYLDTLVQLADALGVDAKFHGWLDNDSRELKDLFETSSIFVFPSHAENFPLVLLEAMAAGMAVITTNQTGCVEVVGDAARCVDAGDEQGIRDALTELTGNDSLRERLGAAARQRVEQHFSWQTVAGKHVDVFETLLRDRTKPAGGPERSSN
jgi:glycosyltransferase involved in cell wall biosynthesis